MNQRQGPDYRRLLASYAAGSLAAKELPLSDDKFWEEALARATKPGRSSSQTANLGVAAERLLTRPLARAAQKARRVAAIQALTSPDTHLRRAAIRLMQGWPPDAEVVRAAHLAAHDRDMELRIEAVRLLARIPASTVLPLLLELLATTGDIRATIAAEALVGHGKAAVSGLTAMLDDEDQAVRWRAALCLAKIAAEDESALPGLLKAFHDDSPNVAWVAADGLLAMGPSVAKDVLRSVIAVPFGWVTIRALHHYAEHAAPARVFRQVHKETGELASGAVALASVGEALKELESGQKVLVAAVPRPAKRRSHHDRLAP